jgi:hypothetical protein
MGYLPSFVLVRAGYRMVVERPPLLGGLTLLVGYVAATLRRTPVVDDPLAIAALREEQRARMRRLMSGADVPPEVPAGGGPSFWAD